MEADEREFGKGGDSCLWPFYTPQVFVVENHPKFEQQLWKFVHNHL